MALQGEEEDRLKEFRQTALAVLGSRLADPRQVLDEYRTVVESDRFITATFTAAQAHGNGSKNRYINVLPYDHNRVCLGQSIAGGGHHQNHHDYINASHISLCDAVCDFHTMYIASQGPLPSTVDAFWQMVWEQRVGAVVMLTNTTERGATKCCAYFPQQPGDVLELKGQGGGQVAVLRSETLHGGDLTHRTLQLSYSSAAEQEPLVVHHLQYHAWPDHGTPAESAPLRTICDMIDPLRAAGAGSGGGSQEVVVHCSAGIGRTGTLMALDVLRMRLAALAQQELQQPGSVTAERLQAAVNLPSLVMELRQQRSGMVQTFEQYAFVYQALQEELASGGPTIAPAAS